MEGSSIPLANGRTTKFGAVPRLNSGVGLKAFAGMRDDPFFFDLPGFLNLTAPLDGDPSNDAMSFIGCAGTRPDFFAGKNVSSIVLEVPDSVLGTREHRGLGRHEHRRRPERPHGPPRDRHGVHPE